MYVAECPTVHTKSKLMDIIHDNMHHIHAMLIFNRSMR